MNIKLSLTSGKSTLTINGTTAEIRNAEDIKVGWHVIKAALFAKHKQYAIAEILRKAS